MSKEQFSINNENIIASLLRHGEETIVLFQELTSRKHPLEKVIKELTNTCVSFSELKPMLMFVQDVLKERENLNYKCTLCAVRILHVLIEVLCPRHCFDLLFGVDAPL